MTPDEFEGFLRKEMGSDTQLQYAKKLGISPQYLSDMLLGRRDPGQKVLSALGLVRHVQYLPETPAPAAQRFTLAQLEALRGVGDVVFKASLPAEEGGKS